jgi:hypothetical protein
VLDTFLIATAKLDVLRDPDRLGPWLHAVARNECLRRLGPGAKIPAPADQHAADQHAADRGAADRGGAPQELPLPPGLRDQVLAACADNSPAGRAHRMSVAHRAGEFGPAGFPKAIGPSGPSWWRRVRRHPGVTAAVAVAAALAVTAGIAGAMTAGASHRPQASGPGLDAGLPAPVSSTTPGDASMAPSPARTASASAPASAGPTSLATILAGVTSAAPSPGRDNPAPSASPSSASPSPFPSTSTSAAPGYLTVAPVKLVLTSVSGRPVSGSFVLTALDGPVPRYAVGVAALATKVKVTPAGGSLGVNGSVRVTVTVTSKVALTTHVIVEPGNLTVTVVYKLKT